MTALEYLKIASEIGAIGIAIYIIYLFVNGKIVSEKSVKKLMAIQANHIGDLRDDIKTKMNEMINGQKKIVDVLEEIKKNGAMNRKE